MEEKRELPFVRTILRVRQLSINGRKQGTPHLCKERRKLYEKI